MAIQTGAKTNIGIVLNSATWAVAAQAGAGHKMVVDNFGFTNNPTPLMINPIGAGIEMTTAAQVGAINPTITMSGPGQYQGPQLKLEAALFGGGSVTTEASFYTQSIMFNSTRPQRYVTAAWTTDTASALEMAAGLPTEMTWAADSPPSYVKKSYTVIGNNIAGGSSTNTATTLAAATLSSTKYMVARKQDAFYIGAQTGGAFTASDLVAATNLAFTISRPMEPVAEISGAATGQNSLPMSSGNPPISATITVTLRGVIDQTFFTAHTAGTEYKAEIAITGDLITGSTYYKARYMFPRLILVDYPEASISSTGENQYTLKFTSLKSDTVPTGMLDPYPHIVYTNASASAPLQ